MDMYMSLEEPEAAHDYHTISVSHVLVERKPICTTNKKMSRKHETRSADLSEFT